MKENNYYIIEHRFISEKKTKENEKRSNRESGEQCQFGKKKRKVKEKALNQLRNQLKFVCEQLCVVGFRKKPNEKSKTVEFRKGWSVRSY